MIIVFDLTDIATFKNVTNWLQSIFKHKSTDIPKVLCGNKQDLVVVCESDNRVDSAEANSLAKEHNMDYFETSAATGLNVHEMFNKTIELVYEQKIKPQIKLEKESGVAA